MRRIITDLSRRIEALTLAGLLAVAGALWAFVALADEMTDGDLHRFDEALLMALRQPGDPSNPIGGEQLEIAMRDLTALGGITVLVIVTVAILTYLVLIRRFGAALMLAVAVVGGQALSSIAKTGFSRPRPDLVPHGVEVMTASFPSGHSMMAAVIYLTLAVMLARTEDRLAVRLFFLILAMAVTVLVGVSRVFLGVHWPSDVLAGWTLGAAWALGVWLAARWLARRGQI